MNSSRRDLTRLIVLVIGTIIAAVSSITTAAESFGNRPSSDIVTSRTDEIDQRMLNVYQKQQQFLFDPPSSSSSSSSLPLAISFDDHDDHYYFRHPDGKVQLRRSVDEKILIDLMELVHVSPLRPNYEDRKPVVEILVDLFHRSHRHPAIIVHNAPVLRESVLTGEQTPLGRVDETDLLLFLADVFDRMLYMNERRVHGDLVSVSEVGHESRLEKVVAELKAAVDGTDADPERDQIRQMSIHVDEDNL